MLTRWEPFGSIRRRGNVWNELTTMQQEMNRLFDEFFGEQRTEFGESAWLPVVDVSENEAELSVRAELPGMTQEDIELNLQDNVLTITGEKKKDIQQDKENFHRIERSFGSFRRSFTLPCSVKSEEISASFKDGVLKITLPKKEEAKPQKIEVTKS